MSILLDVSQLPGVFSGLADAIADMDFTLDFDRLVPILQAGEMGMLQNQQDSSGRPWAPLQPTTIANKEHATILLDTGKMFESLTMPGGTADTIWATSRDWLVFGTSVEYATYHQTGTRRMPARPPVGVPEATQDALAVEMAQIIVDKL